jgi:rubrerythrin
MSELGSTLSGQNGAGRLSDEELLQAIRFMVAADHEATQPTTQLAESTGNKIVMAVLMDIADEELVHAGEFLRLLHQLAPDEQKFYTKGAKEVEEMIKEFN